jgi:hypothetical protein
MKQSVQSVYQRSQNDRATDAQLENTQFQQRNFMQKRKRSCVREEDTEEEEDRGLKSISRCVESDEWWRAGCRKCKDEPPCSLQQLIRQVTMRERV